MLNKNLKIMMYINEDNMTEPATENKESNKCPVCNGKGILQDPMVVYQCPYCQGTGIIEIIPIEKEEIHEIKGAIILDDPLTEEELKVNIDSASEEIKEDIKKIDKRSKEYRDNKEKCI